ncbi:MAG TPA: hypothetical protein DEQ30_12215 [Porphyromonadaceae bacterium]|nr:hypothetical protein [Porphyromonadaceae bacterium]
MRLISNEVSNPFPNGLEGVQSNSSNDVKCAIPSIEAIFSVENFMRVTAFASISEILPSPSESKCSTRKALNASSGT